MITIFEYNIYKKEKKKKKRRKEEVVFQKMMNTIAPNPRKLESFITTLLSTDLPLVIGFYIFLFEAIAVVILLILEYALTEEKRDHRYTYALNSISIIIGLIYGLWIRESMNGYDSGPRSFNGLLFTVTSFSGKLFTLTRIGKFDAVNEKQSSNKIDVIISDTRDTLIAIGFYGYRLFYPPDPNELSMNNLSTNTRYIVETHRGNTPRMISELENNLFSNIKQLNRLKILSTGDEQVLSTFLEPLTSTIKGINSGYHIVSPGIFHRHIIITLFIYFILWTPYTMWMTIGFEPTLVVYPLVMYILSAPIIYRNWLGNPFDPHRKLKTMDYREWIDEMGRTVDDHYKNTYQ